ncbi:MAG: hypothetical protein KIC47_04825 [Clostridium sp.]|nr:hypothetical protein [Clostridium sp.]
MKKIKKYPLTFIILFFIFIVFVIDIFNSDIYFSNYENRTLAQKPNINYSDLVSGRFSKNYERYINDQFIFRDNWINLKSGSELLLGKLENNNIIYGKENFLFDKVESIDNKSLEKNLSTIKDFTDRNSDSNISFMIIPSSFTIYKDLLPKGISLIDEKSYIESIYSKFDNTKNIELVELLKENNNEYIYYKTDHHWTSYGAYLAYREFSKINNIAPIEIEAVNPNYVYDFYGTYFSKSKKFNAESDTITFYDINNIDITIDGVEVESINDDEKWSSSDKYSAFLRGNNGLTIINNNNIQDNSRILVIKDSYANSYIQFLANNYKEVYIIDLRSFPYNFNEFYESYKFDNVLIMYSFINLVNDVYISKLKY